MTTFAEIGVHGDLLKGIGALGFTAPTPVQEEIIPIVLNRKSDLVGLAQTGTGKTAAFGIPLVQQTDTSLQDTQALVLCPTRELCMQVARDLTDLARYVNGLKVVAVYGGSSIDLQISALKKGVHIIVATPGRLLDLLRRRMVDLSRIRTVVLDEADEMLQMGFQDELNGILDRTPDTKNTLLFSATMPKGVVDIAGKYMTDPIEITIGRRNAGSENVRHIYYMVPARQRYQALRRLIDFSPTMYAIVFCRTRQETKDIADKLVQDGYSADALHGDLSQSQRDQVMAKFHRRNLQLLVATDVAARGLDVNELTHVINCNLPDEISAYTHRSGRTGRAGKTGISIAIIHGREKFKIKDIEKLLQRKFEQGKIPTGHDICEKQLFNLMETMKQVAVDHDRIEPFLEAVTEQLAELDRHELIKRFVALTFNRFLEEYRHAPDLNVFVKESENKPAKTRKDKRSKRERQPEFSRFYLNVGKKDGMFAKRLIGQLNEATGSSGIKLGRIEVMNNSTILEADARFGMQVQDAFQDMMINGKIVSIELAREKRAKKENGGLRANRKPSKVGKSAGRKKAKAKTYLKSM